MPTTREVIRKFTYCYREPLRNLLESKIPDQKISKEEKILKQLGSVFGKDFLENIRISFTDSENER